MGTTEVVIETYFLELFKENSDGKIPHYRCKFLIDNPDESVVEEFHSIVNNIYSRTPEFTIHVDGSSITRAKIGLLIKQAAFMTSMKDKTKKQVRHMTIVCSPTGKLLIDLLFKIKTPSCPTVVNVSKSET